MIVYAKRMRSCLIGTLILISFSTDAQGAKNTPGVHSAFMAIKDHQVILEEGNTCERHTPFSTFKVALALIGFEQGILKDRTTPEWPYRASYARNFPSWYTPLKGMTNGWLQNQNPATFMKYSVLWFSHEITKRLGLKPFKNYVKKLNYGNKNVSGTPGKEDGLLKSWLDTSLQISVAEQASIIEKLATLTLPFSKDAQKKTKQIMDLEETWDGWKLYGKTGGGSGTRGWFVGWIERESSERIVFVYYLDKDDPAIDYKGITIHKSVGKTAKELAKKKLTAWIEAHS